MSKKRNTLELTDLEAFFLHRILAEFSAGYESFVVDGYLKLDPREFLALERICKKIAASAPHTLNLIEPDPDWKHGRQWILRRNIIPPGGGPGFL